MATQVFRRVLVGWDGSRAAAKGLTLACRLTAGDGRVTALSVIPSFDHIEADDDRQRAVADARAPLQAKFDQVVASLQSDAGSRVELRFISDVHVADALERLAREDLDDLLIVGLHGREGILHPKMGHIANHVVKFSSCPVLVVPDDQAPGVVHVEEPSHLTGAMKGLFHPLRHHDS
jgi:nucleotide-binding universal stress UspA family protein